MTVYPDKCVLLKIRDVYKLFATIYGGYTSGEQWLINSGIVKVEQIANGSVNVYGVSGSIYNVNLDWEGTTVYSQGVLDNLIKHALNDAGVVVEILPLKDLLTLNSVL